MNSTVAASRRWCAPVVAAEPRRGERQERPEPLAAGLDQVRRHLGDARRVLARHPLADQPVHPVHVFGERRLQRLDRGGLAWRIVHRLLALDVDPGGI